MRVLLAILLAVAVVAGCTAPAEETPTSTSAPAPPPRFHVLDGAVEPDELLAPTFRLVGAIAAGGPLYGAGEPGIWGALDGSTYVSFPGCDDGPYYFVSYPNSETCGHGLIWKTSDAGETWRRLNRHPDGRLADDGPEANGDADVAVDSAGTVFASNLGGGGIQIHRSEDGGLTWNYTANIVPVTENPADDPELREGADRQWIAAAGPGHIINTWMRTSPARDVAINTTFDGGRTWTGRPNFGDGIGWLGTVQFAPDGQHAYIPYTQPTRAYAGVGLGDPDIFDMHVIRTADGGLTWEDINTGMSWQTAASGLHWSGGYMAPALDVTGNGMVVVAMAVDNPSVGAPGVPEPTPSGTSIIVRTSIDFGATWSDTVTLREAPPAGPAIGIGTRIFPWVTGGAEDRFAITYFSTPAPTQADFAGSVWALEAIVIDGVAGGNMQTQEVVIDPMVHEGPICSRGGLCAGPVDRTLLDYFESDLDAAGNLIVVYPADSAASGKDIEIRVAIQNGGSPLAIVE